MTSHPSQPALIFIGASVRGLASTARRAGLTNLHGVDLFADADTALFCQVRRIAADAYPNGFVDQVEMLPTGHLLYTGALENHPRLLGRLGRRRNIWGNSPEALRQVRDPFLLARTLKEVGFPFLQVRR